MKKPLTIIVAGLFFCFTAKAQETEGKCVSGNCLNGIGTYEFKVGEAAATYKGSFKNGKFNGQGNLVVTGVYKYTGGFKDGMLDGKGTYTFSNGDVYTGEMHMGNREGTGTVIFKNGKRSTGIWKEGKLWAGTGLLIYKNNDSYYGGIKENNPDGQGVFNYSNGKSFAGIFSKGNAVSGKGYLFYPADSSIYEGNLVNERFNGLGTFTLIDGEKFIGSFTDGKLNDNGKWIGPSSEQYDGNFKDGKFDGYGVLKFKDGYVYKGNFTNDQRNGTGDLYDANGNLDYSGDWNDGKKTNPENSVSYKKKLWEDAKKVFSRVTFKGWQKVKTDEVSGTIEITDEFYLNSDYTFYGTMAYVIDYKGKKYRTKMKAVGTFDPLTNAIHISPRDIIYHDEIEGMTWMRGACDGEVYDNNIHPGYYIIKGKTMSGLDFEEGDYY